MLSVLSVPSVFSAEPADSTAALVAADYFLGQAMEICDYWVLIALPLLKSAMGVDLSHQSLLSRSRMLNGVMHAIVSRGDRRAPTKLF